MVIHQFFDFILTYEIYLYPTFLNEIQVLDLCHILLKNNCAPWIESNDAKFGEVLKGGIIEFIEWQGMLKELYHNFSGHPLYIIGTGHENSGVTIGIAVLNRQFISAA
jgi:hypothetical protein